MDAQYLDTEGYRVLASRKKDIIIRGSINISPVQIGGLLMAQQVGCRDCCISCQGRTATSDLRQSANRFIVINLIP